MEKVKNKKTLHGIILGAGAAVSACIGSVITKDLADLNNLRNLNIYQFNQFNDDLSLFNSNACEVQILPNYSVTHGTVSATIDPTLIDETHPILSNLLDTGLASYQIGVISGLISAAVLVGIPATIFAVQKHKINKLSKEIEQEK